MRTRGEPDARPCQETILLNVLTEDKPTLENLALFYNMQKTQSHLQMVNLGVLTGVTLHSQRRGSQSPTQS